MVRLLFIVIRFMPSNVLQSGSNKWTQNGWLNVHGQTISNYDLVTKNYELYEWINDEYDDRGWGGFNSC